MTIPAKRQRVEAEAGVQEQSSVATRTYWTKHLMRKLHVSKEMANAAVMEKILAMQGLSLPKCQLTVSSTGFLSLHTLTTDWTEETMEAGL